MVTGGRWPAGTPASDRSLSRSNSVDAVATPAGRWVVLVVVDETYGWQSTEASLRALARRHDWKNARLARLQRAELESRDLDVCTVTRFSTPSPLSGRALVEPSENGHQ